MTTNFHWGPKDEALWIEDWIIMINDCFEPCSVSCPYSIAWFMNIILYAASLDGSIALLLRPNDALHIKVSTFQEEIGDGT